MISKELGTSHLKLFGVDLMADVFKIMAKYRRKIISKYRQISPFIAWWELSLERLPKSLKETRNSHFCVNPKNEALHECTSLFFK